MDLRSTTPMEAQEIPIAQSAVCHAPISGSLLKTGTPFCDLKAMFLCRIHVEGLVHGDRVVGTRRPEVYVYSSMVASDIGDYPLTQQPHSVTTKRV